MLGTLPEPLGSWARLLTLTWLESAGEGWGRLDKAAGPVWAWIDTLALTEHSDTLLSGTFVGLP